MKKMMIIGGVLVIMLIFTSCSKKDLAEETTAASQEEPTTVDANDMSYMTYVDDTINTYVKSEAFQKGNLNDRLQGMRKILDSLVGDNYLQNYHIYDNSDRPRVEYTYAGGEIGCTLLTELKNNQN